MSTINLTNGAGDKQKVNVTLNPHLLRKMEQAQRNMMRRCRARWRPRRRMLYWSRQFRKWCDLLIERAEVIE